jgi:NAD(P)H-quinone oxidoreductase subunit 5
MTQLLAQSIWLTAVYPLIGIALSILWSPRLIHLTGPRPAGYLNLLTSFFSLVHALLAFPAVWNAPAQYQFFTWLQVAGLNLTIPIEISAITVGAVILVTGLNVIAQVYAIGYLEMDWGWARLFALLGFFEAGITGLALCNSLFFSYFILEFLTLGTYLLIGFWLNQSLVVTGARDAFLTKRVGDLFLLMGVLALYPLAGTWDFNELATWAQTAHVDPTVATLLGLALIAGPMGKCAQFPLHLWLDEAMEGPIPSTVLRNSVVVATGAWVLIKLEPVLALSDTVQLATIAVGAFTAIGATLISIAQIDIKRTLSYLVSAFMGLVFIAVGSGQDEAALLLLLSHAIAMSLLVTGVGSVVFNCITQDVTQLGGLWSRRPITALSFLVGVAGLVGLPPLGGFWALLDLIDGLWATQPALVAVILGVNALSAFSIMRVFGLVFGGKPTQMTERSPEPFWLVTLPMTVLVGFVLHLPIILSQFSLLPSWANLSKDMALVLTWSSITGLGLGALVYLNPMISKPIRLPWKSLQDLLAYDFYTPQIYRTSIVFSVDVISRLTDWLDRYVVDGLVNFVGAFSLFGGESLKYSNSGQGQFYMLTIALGVSAIAIAVSWSLLTHLDIVFSAFTP